MSTRFDPTDEEWALIVPLLPQGLRGVPRADDRRVLNGIFYVLRTGRPWRDNGANRRRFVATMVPSSLAGCSTNGPI